MFFKKNGIVLQTIVYCSAGYIAVYFGKFTYIDLRLNRAFKLAKQNKNEKSINCGLFEIFGLHRQNFDIETCE